MKIIFLTSGHYPKDDRIYYHQAITLAKSDNKVEIISSRFEFAGTKNNIIFNSFKGDHLSKKKKKSLPLS